MFAEDIEKQRECMCRDFLTHPSCFALICRAYHVESKCRPRWLITWSSSSSDCAHLLSAAFAPAMSSYSVQKPLLCQYVMVRCDAQAERQRLAAIPGMLNSTKPAENNNHHQEDMADA